MERDAMAPTGEIPMNPGDLPIDAIVLEESGVYDGVFKRATVSPKPNKSGFVFCALQLQVSEGDFEGITVMMNHLPLPVTADSLADADGVSTPTRKHTIQAHNHNVSFGRFALAFKIKDAAKAPKVDLRDPDSIGRWQEWISQYYNNRGKFTVHNQEFPEGSGRLRSGVNDFMF